MPARGRRLSTVQTALRVVGFLTANPAGLDAAEIAKRLSKSLSSAYALLNSLSQEGFVTREGSTYRLADGVVAPSAQVESASLEPEALLEALEELYLRTHERAYLVLGGSPMRIWSRGRQGQPKPQGIEERLEQGLHALALGKALLLGGLLWRQDTQLESLELRALTPQTITDPEALRDDLERAKQQGVTVDLEEFAIGFSGLAAPIFLADQVVGAMGVVMPSKRFPFAFSRVATAVREVALAASLDHQPMVAANLPQLAPSRPTSPAAPVLTTKQVILDPFSTRDGIDHNHALEVQRSLLAPDAFWADWAQRFFWFQPWERVLEGSFPEARWFVGAKTNICHNALDRHVFPEAHHPEVQHSRRNQLALIARSGDGLEHKLTYRELLDRVSRLAGVLHDLGVRSRDRVLLCLPSGLEAVLTMLACARIGAVHVLLPVGLGIQVIRERLESTTAKLVVAADRWFRDGRMISISSTIEQAVGEAALVLWHNRGASRQGLDFWELLQARAPGLPCEPLDADHPLFLLHTSGNMDKPKAVIHAHGGYMVGITYMLRHFFDARDDDVIFGATDLAWVVGHSHGLYAPLLEGMTVLVCEDQSASASVLGLLERHGVNIVCSSVARLRQLRQSLQGQEVTADLSNLRLLVSGGETLPPDIFAWTLERLGTLVLDHWWQTETGSVVLGTPREWPARPGRAGVPLPGIDAVIVDEHGVEVAVHQPGQLVLRQPFPHFMCGFWNDPEAHRQVFVQLQDQSWAYATGDLALRDEEGYVQLLGRVDDALRSGDYRIGTLEIEGVLASHDAVNEVAVVEANDAQQNPIIKAFVTLRDPEAHVLKEVLEGRLKTFVRKHFGPTLSNFEIEILHVLPRTKSGKLLRQVLLAQLGQP